MCRRSPSLFSRPGAFSHPSLFSRDFPLRHAFDRGISGMPRVVSPNLADESLFRDLSSFPVPRGETRHRERQINLRRRSGYARYYINEYISCQRFQVVTTRSVRCPAHEGSHGGSDVDDTSAKTMHLYVTPPTRHQRCFISSPTVSA